MSYEPLARNVRVSPTAAVDTSTDESEDSDGETQQGLRRCGFASIGLAALTAVIALIMWDKERTSTPNAPASLPIDSAPEVVTSDSLVAPSVTKTFVQNPPIVNGIPIAPEIPETATSNQLVGATGGSVVAHRYAVAMRGTQTAPVPSPVAAPSDDHTDLPEEKIHQKISDSSEEDYHSGHPRHRAATHQAPHQVPSHNVSLSPLVMPWCQCKGQHGATDVYKNGAKPSDITLCASPWGGPVQYCYPVPTTGVCPPSQKKCYNPPESEIRTKQIDSKGPCLCGFDIDRTLTAKQGSQFGHRYCPNVTTVRHAFDSAFGGGPLTLAAAAAGGIANTSCGQCYVSIVSQGQASGTTAVNRAKLVEALMTPPFAKLVEDHPEATQWHPGGFGNGQRLVQSPFVFRQPNMRKQWAVEGVLEWYASKGVTISRERVFFFDDRGDNALYFGGTGMNARQISCASRESGRKSYLGYCGARPEEITLTPGVFDCKHIPKDAGTTPSNMTDNEPSPLESREDVADSEVPPLDEAEDLDGGDEIEFEAPVVDLEPWEDEVGPELLDNDTDKEEADMLVVDALPLPACACAAKWGSPYKYGANKDADKLCANPWGGPSQYCYPVLDSGRCHSNQMMCDNTLAAKTVDVGEPPSLPNDTTSELPCLCAFDVDRTLTAKQWSEYGGRGTKKCPNVSQVEHSYDSAFGGGQLTLSAFSVGGMRNTPCGACYPGTVSAGSLGGTSDLNKRKFVEAITTEPFEKFLEHHPEATKWSVGGYGRWGPRSIISPFVYRHPNRLKQWAVAEIAKWYASKGVVIPWNRIFFFDDRGDNALYFGGTGMNAHQISCASRWHGHAEGYCGAVPDEVNLKLGVSDCWH